MAFGTIVSGAVRPRIDQRLDFTDLLWRIRITVVFASSLLHTPPATTGDQSRHMTTELSDARHCFSAAFTLPLGFGMTVGHSGRRLSAARPPREGVMSANDVPSTQASVSGSQVAMRELKRLEKSNEQQPGETALA